MRRRNIALLPGLVAVVVTIAILGQLPSDAGPGSLATGGQPAQSDQNEDEVPLSVRIASAPVENIDLPVVAGGYISLVDGPPEMAMRDEFAPAMREAQIIHDRYAAAVSENAETADATEIWGYDRGEFEIAAGALFEELLADFPDSFSSGVLHPVLPKVVVGFVDDSTAMAEKIASSDFKYDFELREGLLTYQARQELRNVVINSDIGLVGDQYFADPITVAIASDELVNNLEEISNFLSEASGLPRDEFAATLAELSEATPGDLHLLLGPLAIELQYPGDGIIEQAISGGVYITSPSGGACTSGISMQLKGTTTKYASTAEHCLDSSGSGMYRSSTLMPAVYSQYTTNRDYTYLSTTGSLSPALGVVYTDGGNINIKGPWRTSWVGDSRCAQGITTGYTCGVHLGLLCSFYGATYSSDYGDSGGPVLYPYGTVLAAGNAKGACSSGGVTGSTYTWIYEMERGAFSTGTQFSVVTAP